MGLGELFVDGVLVACQWLNHFVCFGSATALARLLYRCDLQEYACVRACLRACVRACVRARPRTCERQCYPAPRKRRPYLHNKHHFVAMEMKPIIAFCGQNRPIH